jgi:hypothetical protein
MSILDLQGLQFREEEAAPAGSRASKGCGNTTGGGGTTNNSTLSVICTL